MTEGNNKEFEMAVGTPSVLESGGMMESENFYAPIESANESEATSQSNWNSGKSDTGQLCRSCANSSDYLIPIYEGEGLEHQLEHKIQKHMPIQVSLTDSLPLQLCYQCASTLIAWDSMVTSCLEADKKLRAMQEAAEDTKASEVYGDSHVEGDEEMVDSDDEPLISSKNKIMNEKNQATPLKKKILSKAKSKTVPSKNDKTATNSKDGEDKERRVFPEDVETDRLLERETNFVIGRGKRLHERIRKREKRISCGKKNAKRTVKKNQDISNLVDESEIVSILEEANRLRRIEIISGSGSLGSTPYVECPICGKLMGKSSARVHLISDHGIESKMIDRSKFACSICGKAFERKNFLRRHILSVHERLVVARCETCGRTFTDGSNYKQHLLIHVGVKSHVCQVCGKGFVQSQGLRMHLNSHSTELPFACSTCGKKFRWKQHYQLHAMKHSGDKPYQCEYCGKFFAVRNELKMHSWIHKEESPYRCLKCDKGFNQSCGLRLHLRKHHSFEEELRKEILENPVPK